MGLFDNAFGGIAKGLDDAAKTVGGAAAAAGDAVGGAAGAVADTIGDAAAAAGDAVGGAAGTAADAAESAANAIGGAASAAVDTAGGAATVVADAVGGVAGAAADTVGGAAGAVANAVSSVVTSAASDVYSSFGGSVDIEQEGNLRLEDGSYLLPNPVVSEAESREIDVLKERYEHLNQPDLLARAGEAIGQVVPDFLKDAVDNVGEAMNEADLYKAAMKIVGDGFGAIEKQAASASVSPEYVVNRINRGEQEQKVSCVEEICLLRSNDVARVVGAERAGHLGLAFFEGAATGAPGFAGIPFNIVLSTFLYFRAVQCVAMFYGYDVKSDPDEMVVAGDVVMAAYGVGDQGSNKSVAAGYVGKVMIISEAEVAKQLVGRGWTEMAKHGGVPLLLTQLRALAHASAKKALANAGKEGLEKSVFSSVFTQIGKRLTQSAIKGAVPIVGGVLGAFFDSGVMSRMLDFAEVFYHKRFILEKDMRVRSLAEDVSFFEMVEEATDIDVGVVVGEAEGVIEVESDAVEDGSYDQSEAEQ